LRGIPIADEVNNNDAMGADLHCSDLPNASIFYCIYVIYMQLIKILEVKLSCQMEINSTEDKLFEK